MDKQGFSLIDINLEALSQPIVKLIESVDKAVGVLYEPTRIRRKAKAEADALIIQAKGETALELELAARASQRINNKELRRQGNIEAIINKTVDQLP